MITERTRQIY